MAPPERLRYVSQGKSKWCLAQWMCFHSKRPPMLRYGLIRARLEKAGRPIGGNDLLIAAQAIALGYILVTDNQREFVRIEDLSCENWLRKKREQVRASSRTAAPFASVASR